MLCIQKISIYRHYYLYLILFTDDKIATLLKAAKVDFEAYLPGESTYFLEMVFKYTNKVLVCKNVLLAYVIDLVDGIKQYFGVVSMNVESPVEFRILYLLKKYNYTFL